MKFKIIATVLNILIMLILAILIRPAYTVEASEMIQVSTGEELMTAIWDAWDAGNEDIVIQLANDIETHLPGWEDKRVTIDLNGYIFHIFTDRPHMVAFWLGGDGELNLIGEGAFNITSVYSSALTMSENSSIMVDNITSRDGITALGNSTVVVRGDVDSFSIIGNVDASSNASVYIAGNITTEGTGVRAINYASVVVRGDVYAKRQGLSASDNAKITVYGNVTSEGGSVTVREYASIVVRGDVHSRTGLSARDRTKITVYGNVTSEGTGVWAGDYASVIVRGDIYGEQHGLAAGDNTEITVYGSITGYRTGVGVSGNAAITVHGNVSVTARYMTGVSARSESIVTIHGHVTGRVFRYNDSVVIIHENTLIANEDDEKHEQPENPQLTRLILYIHSYEIINAHDNSVVQVMDVRPIIQNNRTLVPLYSIANAFGAETNWNRNTQEVTLSLGNENLTFTINKLTPGMDVPAQIISNRVFVPLRLISEFFGAEVVWNRSTQQIIIMWK